MSRGRAHGYRPIWLRGEVYCHVRPACWIQCSVSYVLQTQMLPRLPTAAAHRSDGRPASHKTGMLTPW